MNQANRRQKELLDWLKNFYEYELLPGNPIYINIKEIIGEYRQLPRKTYTHRELTEQKKKDYTGTNTLLR